VGIGAGYDAARAGDRSYTAQQAHTLDRRFRAHHERIVSRQLFSFAARNSANAATLNASSESHRRPQDAFGTDAVVAEPQGSVT